MSTQEEMRSAEADLALCEKVPQGPWTCEVEVIAGPCDRPERDDGGCPACPEFRECDDRHIVGHEIKMGSALENDARWQEQHRIGFEHGLDPREERGERQAFEEAAAIAAFIALGPDVLRHWIKRAQAAEAEDKLLEAAEAALEELRRCFHAHDSGLDGVCLQLEDAIAKAKGRNGGGMRCTSAAFAKVSSKRI